MPIVTPMMKQYQAVKEQYSDCLLFFRLGDFYEMFADDAICASRELNIVLTNRDGGNGQKIPMCGVPHHAVDNYIARLIEKGYKVAICEQMEDPKLVKGIVKREVVRVITPGTIIEDNMLEDKNHNFLAACWKNSNKTLPSFGIAYTDISTGEFMATEISGEFAWDKLADEISRICPAELILPTDLYEEEIFHLRLLGNCVGVISHAYNESFIKNNAEELLKIHFKVAALDCFGLNEKSLAVKACALILDFLEQTQKRSLQYIDNIQVYSSNQFMVIDAATRRNLELTATNRSGKKRGSLLWVIDNTLTSMGGRLIKDWLENPLLSTDTINQRLNGVEELVNDPLSIDDLRKLLENIYDLQRIISRICYGSANPRDLIALKNSLYLLPSIFALLSKLSSNIFAILFDNFDLLEDITELIETAIKDDPPVSAKDSNIIKDGYSAEVDELRHITGNGKNWLLEFEAAEKERTGIRNLKVGYNKVFGYYIEISKGKSDEAPEHYIRKQTLVNGERFITEELKEMETKILSSTEKLSALEYQLFIDIRDKVGQASVRIRQAAEIIAHLDVLQSFAVTAVNNNYCKPVINDGEQLIIKEGRHPVIEKILGRENYIPNNTIFNDKQKMMLITGPNMAGKSTYMRQVALITLMGRIGSYVPADEAVIGYIDRIFTRVGASDDLASGQSTFLVEMNETSNILRNATKNSLIVLDEIGRGTSTFDGMSIAWAVAEYIIDNCAAKTLFATHYHELTALSESFPTISNYSIAVKEKNGKIIFLRKIVEGGTDRSYGIQVAKLAGLPDPVIKRSREILGTLEAEKHIQAKLKSGEQLTFADILLGEQRQNDPPEILIKLHELDINQMTPIEALSLLAKWQKEFKYG